MGLDLHLSVWVSVRVTVMVDVCRGGLWLWSYIPAVRVTVTVDVFWLGVHHGGFEYG